MTDPLTGKQLVEKSYEYIDRLTKECAKALIEEFNSTHRKFQPESYSKEVGNSVLQRFSKRDKNLKLDVDTVRNSDQPNVARIGFKGSTKDADFSFSGTVGTFVVPLIDGRTMSFVKTLVFSVDKTNFSKRK